MPINDKSIKLLWSNAAGRCSFPGCDKRLSVEQASDITPHTLGEMAHIKGKKPGSNRYDANQNNDERDSYQNLILLCPNHHTEIDKPENVARFPTEWLLEKKTAHEQWIISSFDRKKIENIEQLKGAVAALLADTHQAWQKYGPNSLLAMRNPNSDKLYALWTQERLTTIAPNNRAIAKLLTTHRALFPAQQQSIISRFISHATSYEQWINDELPYQAVERFPNDFENIVLG